MAQRQPGEIFAKITTDVCVVELVARITGNCSDQYLGESYSFNNRRGGIMVLNEKGAKSSW